MTNDTPHITGTEAPTNENDPIGRFPRVHPSLTEARVARAVTSAMRNDTFPGFCIACGRKAKTPCEPDARDYPCSFKSCGARAVYGAEQLLFLVSK